MIEFHDIPGFDGHYSISKCGQVKTAERKVSFGWSWRIVPERILPQTKNNMGYWRVGVSGNTMEVHRLLAMTFIPNPTNLPCVNHIDGNKQNNSLDNLEWCTYSQNGKHAYRTGLVKPRKGGDSNLSKLTEDIVRIIKRRISNGYKYKYIAQEFGIHKDTISRINTGKQWAWVD